MYFIQFDSLKNLIWNIFWELSLKCHIISISIQFVVVAFSKQFGVFQPNEIWLVFVAVTFRPAFGSVALSLNIWQAYVFAWPLICADVTFYMSVRHETRDTLHFYSIECNNSSAHQLISILLCSRSNIHFIQQKNINTTTSFQKFGQMHAISYKYHSMFCVPFSQTAHTQRRTSMILSMNKHKHEHHFFRRRQFSLPVFL